MESFPAWMVRILILIDVLTCVYQMLWDEMHAWPVQTAMLPDWEEEAEEDEEEEDDAEVVPGGIWTDGLAAEDTAVAQVMDLLRRMNMEQIGAVVEAAEAARGSRD